MSLEEYSIGDPVSYVFLVDFDRKGEETLFNGTTIVREEPDYFFADLLEPISSDLLEIYSGVTPVDNLAKESNIGINIHIYPNYGTLTALSTFNLFTITNFIFNVNDWEPGLVVNGIIDPLMVFSNLITFIHHWNWFLSHHIVRKLLLFLNRQRLYYWVLDYLVLPALLEKGNK